MKKFSKWFEGLPGQDFFLVEQQCCPYRFSCHRPPPPRWQNFFLRFCLFVYHDDVTLFTLFNLNHQNCWAFWPAVGSAVLPADLSKKKKALLIKEVSEVSSSLLGVLIRPWWFVFAKVLFVFSQRLLCTVFQMNLNKDYSSRPCNPNNSISSHFERTASAVWRCTDGKRRRVTDVRLLKSCFWTQTPTCKRQTICDLHWREVHT